MNHTPGPWEQSGTIIYSPKNGVVCQLSEPRPDSGLVEHEKVELGSENWEEAIANGKVIIAAPDLLAACETALIFCETTAAHLVDDEYRRLVVVPLKAAIAKAKGEAESAPRYYRIIDNYTGQTIGLDDHEEDDPGGIVTYQEITEAEYLEYKALIDEDEFVD